MIYTCTLYNSNNNAIKVAASGSYSTSGLVYSFTIALNPNIYVSPLTYNFLADYFYVNTYTNNNHLIDITDPVTVPATLATFYLSCSNRCKACLDSNTSYCLSCYQTGDGYFTNVTFGGYNTMTSNNKCVDVCGDGFYNASGLCIACAPPCLYCTSAT